MSFSSDWGITPGRRVTIVDSNAPAPLATGGGGSAYVGPGDVVAGAAHFWGFRSYSSATPAGTPMVDLVDSAGANAITLNTTAGGGFDFAGYAAWGHGPGARVTKIYDQIGTAHLNNATGLPSTAAVLTVSGALVYLTCLQSSNQYFQTASAPTYPSPATISGLYFPASGAGSSDYGLFSDSSGFGYMADVETTSPQFRIFNGAFLSQGAAGCSLDAWHSLSAVFNPGTSNSIAAVDSSPTTGSAGGTPNTPSGNLFLLNNANIVFNGRMIEATMWGAALTGTQCGNVSANAHSYWGV